MYQQIKLTGITKVYGKQDIKTIALDDISLHLHKDDFTSIIGSSGSGKSTLLSIIGTLEKPTSGTVFYNEKNISQLRTNQLSELRNKHIGFIFQQFHLLPALTAVENVLAPLFHRKTGYNKNTKAKELLELVGLSDKLHALPSQLSGGQQQRVAIARALIAKPDWILADEPTGNLDSETCGKIIALLMEIKREADCGVLLVTHDMGLSRQADRVIEMKDGQIIADTKLNDKQSQIND
ncbi:ABC transporter ATP-binding protein [Oceanobacillus neutriphilus]|uniref:Macrolide ABC transporter ATP-binding protein n=1 Tax=Oceanobacillus neutriphilus TaxID=531815 RepID=A0ABQ2NS61_9BACI|nr:ABC transporter ATP-binding protein [Oceanobacillus neutriphilus]GGP08516.1 macrolide ABC transporter ATP-binding protein [Oceanobacillus neutriphilus]